MPPLTHAARLPHRESFFGPAQSPGGWAPGVEAFEGDELAFFAARTTPVHALCSCFGGSTYVQMVAQFGQALAFGRAAQKAVVPDANKALRQDVLHKAPYELQLRKLHAPLAPLLAVVFVAKTHLALANRLQPVVADNYFVGKSAQILHHLPRPSKGPFGIHHPRLCKKCIEQGLITYACSS